MYMNLNLILILIVIKVQELANKLLTESNIGTRDIEKRCQQLAANWQELNELTGERGQKLEQSLAYQNWLAAIEEELSWINEKQHVIASGECGNTLAAAQGLIKKHDAFETDFNVHKERLGEIVRQGEALIDADNHHSAAIRDSLSASGEMVDKLTQNAQARKERLQENWAMLQFFWKADVVENWIAEKQAHLKTDDCGTNLSSVRTYKTF
jgi:spectrin alpha